MHGGTTDYCTTGRLVELKSCQLECKVAWFLSHLPCALAYGEFASFGVETIGYESSLKGEDDLLHQSNFRYEFQHCFVFMKWAGNRTFQTEIADSCALHLTDGRGTYSKSGGFVAPLSSRAPVPLDWGPHHRADRPTIHAEYSIS